jgi:hypothetical protein
MRPGGIEAVVESSSDAILVNVDNFERVETNRMFAASGVTGRWNHVRVPTPLNEQTVIRPNRDTLFSSVLVDISEGAALTLPETGGRYMTVMAINQDHYINRVFDEPGTYDLTMAEFDTPFLAVVVRTLIDASDPEDVALANALQDQLRMDAVSSRPFVLPNYDEKSHKATYDALIELSRGVGQATRTFGKREDVDPVRHLIGTAFGWGGLPEEQAYYLNVEPGLPVGEYRLTVKDVPVDAFWSITVYNKDGFLEKNDLDTYNVGSVTATPNSDGSVTVNFGGCEDGRPNCLPLIEEWNYIVRLYQARPEILDGSWVFPAIETVNS